MLQQILKDMYIDPDVLDALNEDQKKTLFLKMRQEQVRRWIEREEKQEREEAAGECRRAKPKKANSKSVSWLLGRDGDVAVILIGEVDELSSKFICSGFGERKAQSVQSSTYLQTILKSRNTTEPVRTERENILHKTQPGISLNLKEKRQETSPSLPLPVSVSEHSSPPAAEAEQQTVGATEDKSVPEPSICSRAPVRVSPVSGRPGFTNLRLATAAPYSPPSSTVKIDSGSRAPTTSGLCSQEPQQAQEAQVSKDIGASQVSECAASKDTGPSGSAPTCAGRGRVAQLMKTFSTDSATPPSRGIKPALPSKPSHLRLTTTPSVR